MKILEQGLHKMKFLYCKKCQLREKEKEKNIQDRGLVWDNGISGTVGFSVYHSKHFTTRLQDELLQPNLQLKIFI